MSYKLNTYIESSKSEGKILLKAYSEYSEEEMIFDEIKTYTDVKTSYKEMEYQEITSLDLSNMIDDLEKRLKTFVHNSNMEKERHKNVLQAFSESMLKLMMDKNTKDKTNELTEAYQTCTKDYLEFYSEGYDDFTESLKNTIKELGWYKDILDNNYRAHDEKIKIYCAIV